MQSVTHAGRSPSDTTGLPPALGEVPFGVLRPVDGRRAYAVPSPQFARLVRRGVLHKLATGYYAVVPEAERGRRWLPSTEAAAFGIAAADHGPSRVVLMGLSAARLHGAVPRALGVAVVAVPKQRPPLGLADREAEVVFVRRNTDGLDAERVRTDLGSALVTRIEQTVLDLAHRPELGGVPDEARAAARDLLPRCDPALLDELAVRQRRRASLARARASAA